MRVTPPIYGSVIKRHDLSDFDWSVHPAVVTEQIAECDADRRPAGVERISRVLRPDAPWPGLSARYAPGATGHSHLNHPQKV